MAASTLALAPKVLSGAAPAPPARPGLPAPSWRGAVAPDHVPLKALFLALLAAGPGAAAAGWRRFAGGARLLQRVGLSPVVVRLLDGPDGDALDEVSAMSPIALDVLTVVVDRLMADGRRSRLIRCSEVLEAKGCRRWGEERATLESQVREELVRLARLRIGDSDLPLFTVAPAREGSANCTVSISAEMKAAWEAAPLRRIDLALLAFDHRANRGADVLAKKLGLLLSVAGGKAPVVRSIGGLLAALGLAQEASSGARIGRMADRLEEALLRLQERRLFEASIRGRRDLVIDEVRTKGWGKRWMETELVFRPLAA